MKILRASCYRDIAGLIRKTHSDWPGVTTVFNCVNVVNVYSRMLPELVIVDRRNGEMDWAVDAIRAYERENGIKTPVMVQYVSDSDFNRSRKGDRTVMTGVSR